jgi:tetratricopeptide (TPR) repeat protein
MGRRRGEPPATDRRDVESGRAEKRRGHKANASKKMIPARVSGVAATIAFALALAILVAELRGVTESDLFIVALAVSTALGLLFTLLSKLGELKLPRGAVAGYLVLALVVSGALYAALAAVHSPVFARMSGGGLNVAVARFAAPDDEPDSVESARRLSESLYESLRSRLRLSTGAVAIDVQIVGPDEVPSIEAATDEDRADEAADAADRLGADLVVYGQVASEDGRTVVRPEFFVGARHLLGGEELAGQHDLGDPLVARGEIGSDLRAFGEVRDELRERTRVLSEFVAGLADYRAGDYAAAGRRFEMAVKTGSLGSGRGREVGLLFIGNAALQQDDLDVAARAYRGAMEANPGSARAYLGLGEVAYARASDGCKPSGADRDGLRRSVYLFEAVERDPAPPPLALIRPKSQLGAGRAYTCLAFAGDAEAWSLGVRKLEEVVAGYENVEERSRSPHLREIVALASAELALAQTMLGTKEAYDRAASLYREAVTLTDVKSREAIWWGDMAFSLAEGGRCAESRSALHEAVELDRRLADKLVKVRALCPQGS